MAIIYRNALNRPLTNTELDNNFEYLDSEVLLRYRISDFTALKISQKLNTPADNQSHEDLIQSNAINAWVVRDLEPSDTLPQQSDKSSVMTRDASGDVEANIFIGDLNGNADTATEADHAASSADLDLVYTVPTVQGGTGARNADDARDNLSILGTEGKDQMSGTLKLVPSDLGLPSLRFGIGTDVQLASAENGDVWFTSAGIRYRVNNILETVAKLNSPTFTGVPKAPYGNSSSQIATIDHVDDAVDGIFHDATERPNHKLDLKANSASPALTGVPTTPTAGRTTNNTQIASTAFVHSVSTYDSDAALASAKTYSDNKLTDKVDGLFNTPSNYGTDKLDLKANIASPGFSGTPTAPTPAISDNSTRIATTAYNISYFNDRIASYYTKTEVDNKQPMWGTSRKFVQSSEPTDAVNGDFWFKI